MRYTVTFAIEADNNEAAEELIGTWTVTPGTTLNSIMPMPDALPPAVVDAGGSVATAIARARAPQISLPPPLLLQPPAATRETDAAD